VQGALITGGTGFIGGRLAVALLERGARVHVLTREADRGNARWSDCDVVVVRADLSQPETLRDACRSVDTVFHLAGYAHADDANDAAASGIHHRVTVEGTKELLAEAVRSGVRRFIFTSSVKAMGEGTDLQLDERAWPTPKTAYGCAKLAAEELVLEAGQRHGMHSCVLRLPLVYGLGHLGNLARLIEAIDRGGFPPFPEVHNHRSMVHVDDVVQALLLAAEEPTANGRTYIVTDGQIRSTRQIYESICQALGRPVPNWHVPVSALRFGAWIGDALGAVTGKRMVLRSESLDKLLGSAWYSSEKIQHELGFAATRTLESALPEMVAEYQQRKAAV
jgi:nucleoside-diphosphate-sugar epimerase